MKILHIASGDLWAGAEKQMYVLLKALQQTGQVEVAAAILNPGTLASKIRGEGIQILVLDESKQGALQLFESLRAFAREIKPDVIHTHRFKENILGGLLAKSMGIRSLRTQHGADEHESGTITIRKRALDTCDYLIGRYLQDKIVSVSESLADNLRERFPVSQVHIIHNGLPIDQPPPNEKDTFGSPIQIGIVGRLVPVKRVDLFLDIAQATLIDGELPEKPCFQVIGDGPLRGQLETRAQSIGIGDHVTFSGHTENAEQRIAELDVLIICSDHEGLPMVSLEAMKHGTLILTHPIGGLIDLLGSGRFGYLAQDQSVAAFAMALKTIIRNRSEMRCRVQSAYHQLRDHYGSGNMAQQYIELYHALQESPRL